MEHLGIGTDLRGKRLSAQSKLVFGTFRRWEREVHVIHRNDRKRWTKVGPSCV